MTFLPCDAGPRSNPTERSLQQLRKRAAYANAHRPYVDYLHVLLDRAVLPASTWTLPNVTSMAAMLEDLRTRHPNERGLNGVVLGRFLHRILHPLLTWHGGQHLVLPSAGHGPGISYETTVYRFPMVQRCRRTFEEFADEEISWSNDLDQWQSASRGDEW